METLISTGFIVLLIVVVVSASLRIAQEYERGVIFRLGRLVGVRGPGLYLLIPFIERARRMDLRVVTVEIPSQDVITRDNVTLQVTAVLYFRIVSPQDAIVQVADYTRATFQIAQTTLRSVLGQSELDELLAHREELNDRLQRIIDEQTEPWGIKVSVVEIKDVDLPQEMRRAIARQAEAERERRAKVIHADGEFQAAQRLADAAQIIGTQTAALQLRYLQTLTEIATERTTTIVFPIPIDLVAAFVERIGAGSAQSAPQEEASRNQL